MLPIIVIIDSGIDKDIIECEVVDILDKGEKDTCGHGTACAMVVASMCPSAKIISVPLLDREGSANNVELEKILLKCLDMECNIISLSLSIIDNNTGNIEEICSALRRQGKLVIASVANRKSESKPAIYKDVIGVRGKVFDESNRYWYNPCKKIQMVADMSPIFTDRSLGRYFVFSGNSKATALASGLIAQHFIDNNADTRNILKKIADGAERIEWSKAEICSNKSELMITDAETKIYVEEKEKIKKIISGIWRLELNDIKNNDDLFEKNLISPYVVEKLMEKINNIFGVKLDFINTTPKNFITINNLAYTIGKMKYEKARDDI